MNKAEEMREAVARIVDPKAWRRFDLHVKSYASHVTPEQRREWGHHLVAASLAKASEILSLTHPETAVNAEGLREAVARIIGSYVVHDDKGGPDTEVLHDVIGGDYDEATRRVYELADRILSLTHPETAVNAEGAWLVERENRDGLMYAMATRWDRSHTNALRFARKADAEAFAACHAPDFTRVAEHRWG